MVVEVNESEGGRNIKIIEQSEIEIVIVTAFWNCTNKQGVE